MRAEGVTWRLARGRLLRMLGDDSSCSGSDESGESEQESSSSCSTPRLHQWGYDYTSDWTSDEEGVAEAGGQP